MQIETHNEDPTRPQQASVVINADERLYSANSVGTRIKQLQVAKAWLLRNGQK